MRLLGPCLCHQHQRFSAQAPPPVVAKAADAMLSGAMIPAYLKSFRVPYLSDDCLITTGHPGEVSSGPLQDDRQAPVADVPYRMLSKSATEQACRLGPVSPTRQGCGADRCASLACAQVHDCLRRSTSLMQRQRPHMEPSLLM